MQYVKQKISRSIFSLISIAEFRLVFKVLISDCPDVVVSFCSISFTFFLFSNLLFVCDWFFSCSFWVSVLSLRDFVLFLVRFDWSANIGPCFKLNSTCSVNMLITYFSSYFFPTLLPLPDFNSNNLYVSKYYRQYVVLIYQNVLIGPTTVLISYYSVYCTGCVCLRVLKLDDLYIDVLFFRKRKIGTFLIPTQLLIVLIHRWNISSKFRKNIRTSPEFYWILSRVLIGCFRPIVFCRLLIWISSSKLFRVEVLCLFFRLSIFPFFVCCFYSLGLPGFVLAISIHFYLHLDICFWSSVVRLTLESFRLVALLLSVTRYHLWIFSLFRSLPLLPCSVFFSSIFFISFIWWLLSSDSLDVLFRCSISSVSFFTVRLLVYFCLHTFE